MNILSKIFLTFSLLALFAGNAAAQCGGKTVYLQLPSDWGNKLYFLWEGSFRAVTPTKNGNWHIFDFPLNLSNDNSNARFTFTNNNGWNNVFHINRTNYNVTGQADANPFSCSDFSTSGTYIFEDPENPGRTKIVAGQTFTVYFANQRLKSDGTPTTIERYTGSPIIPAIDSVVFEGRKLKEGIDYETVYSNNTNTGIAKIEFMGLGDYAPNTSNFVGKTVVYFYITSGIANATVSSISNQLATGSEIKPQIQIIESLKNSAFCSYTDYSGDCYPMPTNDMCAVGKLVYNCTERVELTLDEKAYEAILREGTDYILDYIDNIVPGAATIAITGIGVYSGISRNVTFQITDNYKSWDVTAYFANQWLKSNGAPTTIELYQNGKPITPAIDSIVYEGKKLTLGTDYKILYYNNTAISNAAKIAIIGKDGYGKVLDFYITNTRSIANATVSSISSQLWNGNEIKPQFAITDYSGAVTLREGLDYTIKYINNIAPGTATIEITGTGIYAGSQRTLNFTIIPTLTATSATISAIDAVTYNSAEHKPSITVTHNTQGLLAEGTDYTISYSNNINAGTGQVHVTGIGKHIGTISRNFTINRAAGTCEISMDDFTSSGIPSVLHPTSSTNGTYNVSYAYQGIGNSYFSNTNIPTNPGNYRVTATFAQTTNYNQCTTTDDFTIYDGTANTINVVWNPPCGTEFTYDGTPRTPWPATTGVTLTSTARTDAGTYYATATLNPPIDNTILANASCEYIIKPKTITVVWHKESKYVYNKNTQGPIATLSDPSAEFRIANIFSGAGNYTAANNLAPYIQLIGPSAGNYKLSNYTTDYEILKKDLKPYFSTTLPDFKYSKENQTLEVPSEVFTDKDALTRILESIIAYDGFATDSKGESDNESVLKGKNPAVEIDYAAPTLSKRVETTQKATATIVTDGIEPDNYALTRPVITIIEMADDEAELIFCRRGSYCTELSEEVCLFVGGTEIASCNIIRTGCQIDESRCVSNMLLASCNDIGGEPIESCSMMSSIMPHIPFSMSHAPSYYNLKGQPLGTAKPTTPGVYIEKAGKQARKILVK